MALLNEFIPRLIDFANNSQLADNVMNTDWNHWKYQFQSYLNDIKDGVSQTNNDNPEQQQHESRPQSSSQNVNRGQKSNEKSTGNSERVQVIHSSNKLWIKLNLENFSPQEISVKVNENYIIVAGEHQEKRDEFGFVGRKLTRKFEIADDIQRESISSRFSNGILVIEADKKVIIDSDGSRVIPVVIEKSGSNGNHNTEDMNLD